MVKGKKGIWKQFGPFIKQITAKEPKIGQHINPKPNLMMALLIKRNEISSNWDCRVFAISCKWDDLKIIFHIEPRMLLDPGSTEYGQKKSGFPYTIDELDLVRWLRLSIK